MYEDYSENNKIHSRKINHDIEYECDYDCDRELKKRQDNFLDSYFFYLKEKNTLHKNILERKIVELELVDPNFCFQID